ncbi:MAG: NAD-dependent epimerase/dehydratase family protein [Lachnospiraceae bacterium]|nr:NAD-dependent epimerase/dehydratase family protein [Lachnospiraceae bacterium]
MNVLLIGGSSRMIDAVIDKLNKGKHRIFLLTGRRDRQFSYKHVFERYDYPYEDESVKDIFESVKPDMVVFMGAYDTNFDWHRERQESVRYTASLMNILSTYSMACKGRFVYLSSHEVFGGSYHNDITESETTTPRGFKALAISQGEEICENYRKTQGVDTMILRFDHLYGVPRRGQEDSNPCFQMCLEALKTGKVSASDRRSFSMLYLNDAVELAYKAMMEEQPALSCYHITSGEELDEVKLAGMVIKAMGGGIRLVNNSVGDKYRLLLDGRSFQEEYDQKIFVQYEEGVEQVVKYMKRHADAFISAEDLGGSTIGRIWHGIKVAFKRIFPFVENLICFVPFFILNSKAADSEYFNRLDFFLLYVLLFAIVYGQQQAIFSSLLAVAGYFLQQMYGRTGFEVLLDYNIYIWMAQLFIIGMVVGYMRDQLQFVKDENEEEVRYLSRKVDDIADMLGELMDSKAVAVYTVANGDYARLFSFTSEEARRLGNSIKYTGMEDLYRDLKEHRVFINKKMDEKLPLMASAVYTADRMELILMIWGIPWQRMTLAEANRLTIIGALIQNAVVHANRYLDALTHERYLEQTNIMSPDAFGQLVHAFFGAKTNGLTECALLEIVTEDYRQAAETLGRNMRQTDYMGVFRDGRFCILLSNTDEKNAQGVIERFRSAGYICRLREGAEI